MIGAPEAAARQLAALGLDAWAPVATSAIESRFRASAHGDFERWSRALDAVREAGDDEQALRGALMELAPWRKGPFVCGPVTIDAEWRSDRKWQRVAEVIEPLDGRHVLDVGCGNGYYALRMHDSGAASVTGIDPTILFLLQFEAVRQFVDVANVVLLPLRLEELPLPARAFDTVFSMGVLYHRRSPIDHLAELRQTLRPGGQLVLETLFLPGDEAQSRTPPSRYARMRNVWHLPTVAELLVWLSRTGFRDASVRDTAVTTRDEQRATDWMSFESLDHALDPDDPQVTVEGWPRPRRVVVTAQAP